MHYVSTYYLCVCEEKAYNRYIIRFMHFVEIFFFSSSLPYWYGKQTDRIVLCAASICQHTVTLHLNFDILNHYYTCDLIHNTRMQLVVTLIQVLRIENKKKHRCVYDLHSSEIAYTNPPNKSQQNYCNMYGWGYLLFLL